MSLAVLSAAAVCGCFPELKAKERPQVVRLCVLPRYSPETMSRRYAPLARYLSQATGYDVRYVGTLNYETYVRTVEWSRVDIGLHNPLIQVALAKSCGARPLLMALEPDGRPRYRGVIIVRTGAAIRGVGDLRGKRIAVGSKSSVGGYLSQQALCREAGVDLDRDCSVVLVHDQERVVQQVARGHADAGFLRESILVDAQTEPGVTEKLQVAAYTDYMPGWCVAAFRDPNTQTVEAIKQALMALTLPRDRLLLDPMNASGFVEATDADFAPVRRLAAKLDIPL